MRGSPPRSTSRTTPPAISTRCRAGSRRSGPGPSWPTGRIGCQDPEHWQGIAREVENKLSDALHERLTERFVDRRTSVLMRRLRENTVLNTEIGKTGEVIVEGHAIGRLDGFTFAPDAAEAGSDAKALQADRPAGAGEEIDARAEKLAAAARRPVRARLRRHLRWTGDAVAKLVPADDALHPRIRIIADERLTGAAARSGARRGSSSG